jgi:ABC-type transport system involved in multi-copper enzyme maturation permease subunit
MNLKSLIKFEIAKSIRRPIVLAVFVGILLVNILMIFFGTFGSEPTYGRPYNREMIMQLQEEQSVFSGVMDEKWIQHVNNIGYEILNNPDNQVSDENRNEITKALLAEGLTEEYINAPDNVNRFVKEEVLASRQFQSLEEPVVASSFYESSDKIGKETAEYYRATYDGAKGEALASKAEEMYGYLSNEYQAYYDYSWGWSRLHAIQTVLPFTIGLFLIVVLSPMFSGEYSKKMDSLILSTKYGKNKLIQVKMITGFSIAICSWILIQFINIVFIFSLFGIEGSKAFIQNWAVNPGPYALNYLTSYLAVTAISFIGLLVLTSMILFISSRCKSSFISLVICSVIVLLPTVQLDIIANNIAQKILMLSPTNILIGVHHFKTFDAVYLFGKVIMVPFVATIFAFILLILMLIATYLSFKRHQVKC